MPAKEEGKQVSILIADDYAVTRRGLRALVEAHPGWSICAEARNGMEAVDKAKRLKPDIAILDITMPELNGLDAAIEIRKAVPRTQVLILTMHSNEELIRTTIRSGAQGYILKSDAERDLVAAIDALTHQKTFFTDAAARVLVADFRGEPGVRGERHSAGLTPREREIVQLLAEGRTNKEVAVRLGISTRTVENHRAKIMDKLNLRSLSGLVRYAIRHNLIEP